MSAILEARGLTKRFGTTQALDGLDLTVNPGQVTAVLGPNGAGKTTFIRMVATLLRPERAGSASPASTHCATQRRCGRRSASLGKRPPSRAQCQAGRTWSSWDAWSATTAGKLGSAPTWSSSGLASPITPIGSSAPTPGGCAGRWISPQAWSEHLSSSSWTSRRPASTPAVATSCGTRSGISSPGAPVCSSPRNISRKRISSAARIAIVDHGRVITEGTPDDLKAGLGLDVVEVHVTHAADLQRTVATIASLGPEAPRVDVPTRAVAVAVDCGSARLLEHRPSARPSRCRDHRRQLARATLDEVFLALTGQSAADETGNAVEVSVTPTEARRRRRRAA